MTHSMNTGTLGLCLDDWRAAAQRRLPRFVFDYIEGAADDESGLARNRDAIRRIRLVPSRLRDVSNVDLSTTLFGVPAAAPIVCAPTGLNGLLWEHGDLAIARAAATCGIPFVLSTASTSLLAEVAASTSADKWFQLYVFGERLLTSRLLHKAQCSGYRVLVLTLDVATGGNRLRDQRNGFRIPFSINARTTLDVLCHLRWLVQILKAGIPELVNVADACDARHRDAASAALATRSMDRTLTWDCIEWLRSQWQGSIVLKGILSAADARRAAEAGVEGIVVSNHGARQLACLPASMDVLKEIVQIAGHRLTVLVDSGFRSGSDVVSALALGAKAVLIGRPLLYGLAARGQLGVTSVLQELRSEMERTLVLLGYSKWSDTLGAYLDSRLGAAMTREFPDEIGDQG
jgi:(S)-mandelate dehydrogenase